MLKFEFDEKKQKIFLNFWKIDEVSGFRQISERPDLFFLRLCLLNEIGLKFLGRILTAKLKNGEGVIQDHSSPPTPQKDSSSDPEEDFPITEEILEMLDSINLINLWYTSSSEKTNPVQALLPVEKGKPFSLAHYQLSKEFETCFQALSRPPFEGSPYLPKLEDIEKLSQKEKTVLSHFLKFYGFSGNQILIHHPEEVLLDLKRKGFIDFFFLPEHYLPAAVVNPHLHSLWEERKSPPPEENPFPKEELAESLFFFQVLHFEGVALTSLNKYHPTAKGKKEFLEDLYARLSKLPEKEGALYRELNFSEKVLFLLKKFLPLGYHILEVLFTLDTEEWLSGLERGISEREFIYQINRRKFLTHPCQESFSIEKIKEVFHFWISSGLLIKRHHHFYGDRETFQELGEIIQGTPAQEKPQGTNLIIDSDYSLIATKDHLQTGEIFFLYHICDLNISPRLVRGQLNTEKSSLAWYYGIEAEQLMDFFKIRSGATWQKNFQEMLGMYFEHTYFFKTGFTVKLITPSKNFFLVLKYFLEENHLLSRVTLLEEQKTFIFHDQITFTKMKEAFPHPPPIQILEEK